MQETQSKGHGPVTAAEASPALADAAQAEPTVLAAYLFGSVATGKAGPLSDLDVALLLAPEADAEAACGRVKDRLCRRLRVDDVDIISLAQASAPLRYRAVRDGKLVLCRDRAAHERLVVRTVLEYLDFEPVRERAFARLRESILREA